ncbi:ABC transporter ATP-binding protein [Vibrio genomosp. F10]|uniref:ABC transporter n=2 Tax=Vibrio genomosp. F10 TaxID=723171 RepID=A0A1B9R1Z3_9VIBR|nr:ABC transporter ATP-binding protein [Vibrio genomosp. F10]OCH78349.1 ABC transporter [Vibrio genomosp. F10]OEE37811.1 ABC transporter [Vibrio genomosp. F10 str. ZF-129]OEE96733.1 ABC transporter [Vibrio genomosp. F10 str. 9ZC157]OEE97573.1 ABC transporter [Vibrio genomosp. F10 str. 9ZD137]
MYALEIEQLRKTYAGGFEALKGISLNVKKGDFYALLGPNGAGKSTTIGVVSSLVNKTSGKVKVFGFDIDSDLELAKQNLGLVPQEFNFNPFETVEQIVLQQAGYYGVPRVLAKERAKKYLSQLDLWEKRSERARNLSGGMKRRLMIARALMHEPQLLILDEPTAGVDIELRRSMWEFLKNINKEQGITIILTTHYLEEAEMLCRNIGIINRGELIENTTMKALLNQLQVETFILDLEGVTALDPLSGVNSQRLDNGSLEIELDKSQGLNHVFSQLTEQGITVLSMRNKANRLEELFVNIVKDQSKASSQNQASLQSQASAKAKAKEQ